jgi:hypothetical protein
VLDFAAWPTRLDTTRAGPLLVIPDLVALDLPGLAAAVATREPESSPAVSWLPSLLALKLAQHPGRLPRRRPARRPGRRFFAGMATLPKKSALTEHSTSWPTTTSKAPGRPGQEDDRRPPGPESEASFDLDFHAVMHWGADPALEKHHVPKRSQRAGPVPTFFAQDSGTHNLVYASADISKATPAREAIAFCDHRKQVTGSDPKMLVMDQKVTTHHVLGELDARGIGFLRNTYPGPGGRPGRCAGHEAPGIPGRTEPGGGWPGAVVRRPGRARRDRPAARYCSPPAVRPGTGSGAGRLNAGRPAVIAGALAQVPAAVADVARPLHPQAHLPVAQHRQVRPA